MADGTDGANTPAGSASGSAPGGGDSASGGSDSSQRPDDILAIVEATVERVLRAREQAPQSGKG